MKPVIIDVVIAAGGSGERLGADVPKGFVEVGGVPMLRYALDVAAAIGPRRTVVVVPGDDTARWAARVDELGGAPSVEVVAGGDTRQASVLNGLRALRAGDTPGDVDHVVLVHDAARPFARVELWNRVAAEAARSGAAVPVLPSVDSLKRVGADGAAVESVDRSGVVRAQTPQGFRFAELLEAHLAALEAGVDATDDAALFERSGRRVATVPGDEDNLKVTVPEDLERAERRLRGVDAVPRVGFGYDTHPLVAGRRLVLGGVTIAHDRGLDGHSDADALAHALIDALLGAAGQGDIGQKFPADDDRWKDADSLELLSAVVSDLAAAGFVPHNVDATILAERPRLLPHLDAMRRRLADRLGVDVAAVNVKATRGEGMGPVGRGEGIAVHAVVTVIAAPDGGGR